MPNYYKLSKEVIEKTYKSAQKKGQALNVMTTALMALAKRCWPASEEMAYAAVDEALEYGRDCADDKDTVEKINAGD